MSDCVVNKSETFKYTYSAPQNKEIERIRSKYLPKQETKLEQMIRLDKQAEKPGQAISLAVGIIGVLIMGIGMCFVMVWNTGFAMMIAGSIIGMLGMGILILAYPIYKKVTEKERTKVADRIIALSEELTEE